MPDRTLALLMSRLARLLHKRSSTPRGEALGLAWREIRAYAEPRQLDETWCDRVLMLFLQDRIDYLAA